ncbi:hypothetical protein HY745_05320 [Candidatus Desantisbacteria bacterium]|nr:hypothetical protein [Candidatus Desantisbacteria bacterium]
MIDSIVDKLIQKQTDNNINIVICSEKHFKEIYITIHPDTDDKISSDINRLMFLLKKLNAEIVKFDIFGSSSGFNLCMKSLNDVYDNISSPITFVEGGYCSQNSSVEIQIYAVSGIPVKTIFAQENPIARVFEDDYAKYCIIGNASGIPSNLQEKETLETFVNIEKILNLAGMDISNIIRTWFYNNNITLWYDKFNTVRNDFFKQKNIYDKMFPVSTGVGGKNIAHSAIIAGVVAIKVKRNDRIKIQELISPLQNPPSLYGSSFSRALEIITPVNRKVLISGTASIDTKGKTVHAGNIDMQIAFTMEVIEAILKQRDMNFSNVIRSITYFKDIKYSAVFDKYCKKTGKPSFPMITIQNDICRDDLLFEIELDAISTIR